LAWREEKASREIQTAWEKVMTTPRDAIGLTGRLRDRAAGTGYGGGDPLCAEAATQLDALSAELADCRSNCAATSNSYLQRAMEAESRATRAEQERASEWNLRREAEGRRDAALAAAGTLRAERDEALERLKPFANGSIDVSGTAVIVGYPDAEHVLKAARNCVRQLKIASGPDKEKK
jgi:hypothetical protein